MIRTIYQFIHISKLPYTNIEHLKVLRLPKLRKLLLHSKNNVPFYQKRLSNIDVITTRTMEDIKLLPIIKAMELREEKTENITANNLDKRELLLHATSGTSGMPF